MHSSISGAATASGWSCRRGRARPPARRPRARPGGRSGRRPRRASAARNRRSDRGSAGCLDLLAVGLAPVDEGLHASRSHAPASPGSSWRRPLPRGCGHRPASSRPAGRPPAMREDRRLLAVVAPTSVDRRSRSNVVHRRVRDRGVRPLHVPGRHVRARDPARDRPGREASSRHRSIEARSALPQRRCRRKNRIALSASNRGSSLCGPRWRAASSPSRRTRRTTRAPSSRGDVLVVPLQDELDRDGDLAEPPRPGRRASAARRRRR